MGTERPAFGGVERLFEQGAEYRGIDLSPVIFGGAAEFADLLPAQRQNGLIFEKLTIEAQHAGLDGERDPALVHRFP